MAIYQKSDGPAAIAVVRMLGLAASWLHSTAPWLDSDSHMSEEGTPSSRLRCAPFMLPACMDLLL